MNKMLILTITALISTTACTDQGYPDDDHFQAWQIGAAVSYNYFSAVEEAYGVNEVEDWTSMMLPYGNLTGPRLNMENYRRYTYPDYDGNVLPLTGAL
ncbi:hypothetical protein HUO09_21735, partial [Vibrio sp. Y2-5]|nr:hypothetical protein [Vibrio sp. Y2-5]